MKIFITIFILTTACWAENSQNSSCDAQLTFHPVTSSCVDNTTATRINNRPSCKNLTLPSDIFQLDNGILQITGSSIKFTENEFTLQNDDSISICYPLTPQFRSCERWGVYPDEYTLKNNNLQLVLTQTGTLINTGDFVITGQNIGVICVQNSNSKNYTIEAYVTAWIISAVSLLISMIIYGITNRKMSYQTKIMMCHMLSLLILYTLLVIRGLGANFPHLICVGYSFVLHYFFLAAFFWINVLAFDIWRKLPKFASKHVTVEGDRVRFVCMSIYAWGMPALIAVCAVLTDQFVEEDNKFKPQFAHQCWFVGMWAKIVFVYGPAAIIIGSNVVFYGLTVWSLKKLSRGAVMVNKKIHAQMTRMYFKLSVVMGLCWIMEIISGTLDNDNSYWYFTDVINGLQGFFLFLVYVCKANVLRDLKKLWTKRADNGRRLSLKKMLSNSSQYSAPSTESSTACTDTAENECSMKLANSEKNDVSPALKPIESKT